MWTHFTIEHCVLNVLFYRFKAKIFLDLKDHKVSLEKKDRGDTQGLKEIFILGPKVRGAHQVTEVLN